MHHRRSYDNPTPPVRCEAIEYGDDMAVKCHSRVVKAGLCGKHHTSYQADKLARHTELHNKVRDNYCECYRNRYQCRRPAVIQYETKKYCQRCFMQEQVRNQRKEAKRKSA